METIDLLKNNYKILQDSEKFKFGIDAILLSDFIFDSIKKGDNIIDLGCGNGIIPLMLGKSKAQSITGLEIQTENVQLAEKSVLMNNLQKKIKIIQGDIKNVRYTFLKHSYDIVASNPPYMIYNHGKQSCLGAKAIARHEVLCNLDDVICASDYLLGDNGKFFMIHRPFRLPEIFYQLINHKIEPKRIRFVQPFVHKEPNLVLIEARKNANPRLKIENNLIVYETQQEDFKGRGLYTKEIENIYNRCWE